MISQSRLSLTETREGIFNSTPFCHVWLAMVVKMKENTRNSVWKSEKLFAGDRYSAKWWWHRKQIKAKLFDLNKKATVMKQVQLAYSAKSCKKTVGGDITKQVRANFQYQKVWLLRPTTFLTFQSPRSASACAQPCLGCFDVII